MATFNFFVVLVSNEGINNLLGELVKLNYSVSPASTDGILTMLGKYAAVNAITVTHKQMTNDADGCRTCTDQLKKILSEAKMSYHFMLVQCPNYLQWSPPTYFIEEPLRPVPPPPNPLDKVDKALES